MAASRKARSTKGRGTVPPGYASALGQAAGEMALLENRLGAAMAALLGIDAKLGRIIYLSSHTPFGRVATLDVIATNVLAGRPGALDRLKGLTRRARELLTRHHETSLEVFDAAADAKRRAAHSRKLAAQSRAVRDLASEVEAAVKALKRERRG